MYRILQQMPELLPYEKDIDLRMQRYREKRRSIVPDGGPLTDFANAHAYYGFHRLPDGWVYREWAPAADALYLTGDFNNWSWTDCPMQRIEGTEDWQLFLPGDTLRQGSRVKTIVKNGGRLSEHMPLYTRRAVQDPATLMWCCEVYDPEETYPWTDGDFSCGEPPLIYEAHVGMANEDGHVGTYREFADNILPKIVQAGYNTVQLMAVMEHPYYGSFGYQVSCFYAASSRFGTPEDLKYLVNTAHSMGLRIILDIVHSHAVKNTTDGINMFDGTEYQFFHAGAKGEHPSWGTKCFDYSKNGVLSFLLSNVKFWLTEYHFDGFRFDGVTSMLYLHHGLGKDFNGLDSYFSMDNDLDAIVYLQLANELAREINPRVMTIAEDMSGMPGMCTPVADGGIGFDYRLAMGMPDMWVKLAKETRDEDWNLGNIWYQLTFRNTGTIAYVESHDQALVGDQTLIFRLAGAAMYDQMEAKTHTPVIDRATALHKLTRLLTAGAGGDGYLNFMGNEFGHPEWIDFPREGNGFSHHYCRRQWSLQDNPDLKYMGLSLFDRDMISLLKSHDVLRQRYPQLLYIHEDDHMLAFERGGLVFVFNFHPTKAAADYPIPVPTGRDHTVLMTSDDARYGGFGRIEHGTHSAFVPGLTGSHLQLYLPPRTAMVLQPVPEEAPKKKRAPRKKKTEE